MHTFRKWKWIHFKPEEPVFKVTPRVWLFFKLIISASKTEVQLKVTDNKYRLSAVSQHILWQRWINRSIPRCEHPEDELSIKLPTSTIIWMSLSMSRESWWRSLAVTGYVGRNISPLTDRLELASGCPHGWRMACDLPFLRGRQCRDRLLCSVWSLPPRLQRSPPISQLRCVWSKVMMDGDAAVVWGLLSWLKVWVMMMRIRNKMPHLPESPSSVSAATAPSSHSVELMGST